MSRAAKSHAPGSAKKARPRKSKPEATACVLLPAMLDMRAARDLKRALEVPFRDKRPCILDASAVASVSTGCAQILTAFARAMRASSVSVTLRRPTEQMTRIFEQLGMADALASCAVEA